MTFETETYGRYDIRSGPLKGSWAANGFRRKKRVAEAMAGTRTEAIGHVKAKLDRLDALEASSHDSEGAPPSVIYQEAFVAALPTVPPSYIAMLKAHLAAPDYLISATKLAGAAGYAGYEGANLHYGKLGALIAGEIGFTPPKRQDGTAIWTCAIARDPSLDSDFPHTSFLDACSRNFGTAHFEWQLRPQVVQALKALGY